jgi:hypothetical protein
MEGGEGEDGRQADEAVEEEAEERGEALQEVDVYKCPLTSACMKV